MKMAPPSADLLIKIAIGAAVVGAAWYAYRRFKETGSAVVDKVSETFSNVVDAVAVGTNPLNPENVVNSAVSATGAKISGQKDWTLGGAVYDLFHTDPLAKPVNPTQDLINYSQVSG